MGMDLREIPLQAMMRRVALKRKSRKYRSEAESECWDDLNRQGIECLKKGWPDFACFRDGKLVAVVEVKHGTNGDKLRPHQERMLNALAAIGIPTFLWTMRDGFSRINTDGICGNCKKDEKPLDNSP